MNSPLVKIQDVHVELGSNPVLRGVNAELERGKITALIGLNGSGKTTLLRALLKEIPYQGRIHFQCGHDHRVQNPKHVGYVPQRLNVDARLPLTVRDLLALALQWRPLFLGIGRRTEQRMRTMLEHVSAPFELLDRLVEKLSGGELQRILLALALEPRPELLLLDEPAAGIDFRFGEKFYELIARVNEKTGVTILLVSHDLSVVSRHAHHVLCLKDGHIHCQGPPQTILNQQMVADTFGAEKGVYAHAHGTQ